MKTIYLVLSLYLFTPSLFSQKITGTLKDSLNNPISFATLQLLSNKEKKTVSYTQSDADGVFFFRNKRKRFSYDN